MMFVPLGMYLPDLAKSETREMFIVRKPGSKAYGSYGLIEMYCKDPKCDCRRVMFNILSKEMGYKDVAIINFGWESKEFYKKRFRFCNEKDIEEMKGPCLNITSPRSEEAYELLHYVKSFVLKDENYVDRIKRHYKMFKEKIKAEKLQE